MIWNQVFRNSFKYLTIYIFFKDLHFIEMHCDVNATHYWIIISKISQKRKKLKFIESETVIDIDG